jgi:hypothetical protein
VLTILQTTEQLLLEFLVQLSQAERLDDPRLAGQPRALRAVQPQGEYQLTTYLLSALLQLTAARELLAPTAR